VAYWINMSSVVASSATVMVVCWIISLLARKILGKPTGDLKSHEAQQIWLASIVGSLSLLFCSTFWNNATETETYALSTLLMCLTIWSMLSWDYLPSAPANKPVALVGSLPTRAKPWSTHVQLANLTSFKSHLLF